MPLIILDTNVGKDSIRDLELAKKLSALAPTLTLKGEEWHQVIVNTDVVMTFAGTDGPTARLKMNCIGLVETGNIAACA